MKKILGINPAKILLEAVMIVFILIYLYPVFHMVFLSMKDMKEIITNPLGIPRKIEFQNFIVAWEVMNYPRAFLNSFVVSVLSILSIVVVSSLAAYPIARFNLKMNKVMYIVFISTIMVPTQTVMIPLVKLFYSIRLVNNYFSLVVFYTAAASSFTIFVYVGFMRTLPRELEEAAIIDGCNPFSVFWRVIIPLIKPATATVIILNLMWVWNDFLMPMILMQKRELKTLTPSISLFFEEYTAQWNYAFAGSVMTIIPGVAAFLLLQKHFIRGLTKGALK